MSQRLIPNSDSEFSIRAMLVAQRIVKEPERFAPALENCEQRKLEGPVESEAA